MSTRKKSKRRGGRPRLIHDPADLRIVVERADLDAIHEVAAEKGVSAASLVRKAIRQLLTKHGR